MRARDAASSSNLDVELRVEPVDLRLLRLALGDVRVGDEVADDAIRSRP